jgi:hypothetical protein
MKGRLPVDATDRGIGVMTAWLGAVLGGAAGAGSALLIARAVGIDDSVADYGLPYQLLLGGGWLGAVLGSGLALRITKQGLALTASLILSALLAPPGLLAATSTDSGPGWPSTSEWLAGSTLYLILPLAAPGIAFLVAEALARRRAAP